MRCTSADPVFARIKKALGLPGETTKASLNMDAGKVVSLTCTVIVTRENLEALAQVLEDGQLYIGEAVELFGCLTKRAQRPAPVFTRVWRLLRAEASHALSWFRRCRDLH